MAQGSKEELFRDRLKDIILHKDQLEDHFMNALQLAKSKEDLVKLNVTITKLERLLNELKDDIAKRIATANGESSTSSIGASGAVPVVANPPGNTSNTAVKAEQYQPYVLTQQNGSYTAPKAPALAPSQERSKEPQPQNTRVFTKSWKTFLKNPNIPDIQRLYVPILGPESTEESLYNFFSQHGTVLDVKLFTFTNGRPSAAAVGFDSASTARHILSQKNLVIDGNNASVRPYYTKDTKDVYTYDHYSRPKYPQLKQQRYQVFCGGIPARATVEEISEVIGMFGKVRDVRVIYPYDGNSVNHRGFAYIDMVEDEDAQYLISKVEPVYILGKEVDCKVNTRPLPPGLALSGSVVSLADYVRPSPSQKQDARADSSLSLNSAASAPGPPQTTSGAAKENIGTRVELCIICKKNPQNCVLLWCGHTDTCKECGDQLKNCPRTGCSEPVESRVPLN